MLSTPTETAEIIDIGDKQMLGLCPSGEKVWLEGPVVPGDHVSFVRKGRIGTVTELLQGAPTRREAPCPHFGSCPGCSLQPLPYPEQCEWKERKILEALRRIGGFRDFEWRGLRASSKEFGTRNKLDLQVQGPQIGYTNGWELLPIQDCMLGNESLRAVLADIKPFFAEPHGIHRLMLRSDTTQTCVHLLLRGDPLPPSLLRFCETDPRISGLSQQPEKTANCRCLSGTPVLKHHLAGIDHDIAYDAFFQVHSSQADRLVRTAMDWLHEAPVHNLLDLFSGAGAFTLPAAPRCQRVLGIDSTPGKGPFLAADLSKGLPDSPLLHKHRWDTVLTDPPRDGMEKRLCKEIRDQVKPERILYISCNPATLARDLSRLAHENTYKLLRAEGFDLFPQTTHVETLALLERNRTPQ